MSAISANLSTPPDNFSTTLSSGINSSALTIPLNSVAGLATEGVGVLFTKDANGDVVAGSVEIIHWTGVGGSSLTLTDTGDRGLTGSDAGAQAYSAGAFFEVWVTSYYYDSLLDGITANAVNTQTVAAAAKATPIDADSFPLVDSAASNALKETTIGQLKAVMATLPLYAPQGFLINGKISVTDAAGITVAIKTLAGTDPSATDPVYIRIGDTVRTISSALSKALADGVNYMNAGSAELATKEIDYFVHIGWNASASTPFIGWARIPCTSIADIASYNTIDAKSLMCSQTSADGLVNADYMEVVGRFAATLSAGAGYTWSVPTYTAINLIQRPIFETRWLDWQPTYSGSGSMTWTSVTGTRSYKVSDTKLIAREEASGTVGGTPSIALYSTQPFTITQNAAASIVCVNAGAQNAGVARVDSSNVEIYLYNAGNWSAGAARGYRYGYTARLA